MSEIRLLIARIMELSGLGRVDECFAVLDEQGRLERYTNKNFEKYIYGLVYLMGEIVMKESSIENIKDWSNELDRIKRLLDIAMANMVSDDLLVDNLNGIVIIRKAFDKMLGISVADADIAKNMINAQMKVVASTLKKLILSIKLSRFNKERYWPEWLERHL